MLKKGFKSFLPGKLPFNSLFTPSLHKKINFFLTTLSVLVASTGLMLNYNYRLFAFRFPTKLTYVDERF